MAKKEVLKVEHVGMKFNLSQEKVDDLKDYVIKLLKHQISYNEFWALKDINFTLNKGGSTWNPWIEWSWKEYAVKGYCRGIKSNGRNCDSQGEDRSIA